MLALILPQCQGRRSPLFVILHETKYSQVMRTVQWGFSSPINSCPSPHKHAQILIFICSLQFFSWHPFCLYGHIIRSQNLKALPLSTNSTANHILSQMTMFASNLVDRICRGYFMRVCIGFSYFIRWLNLPSGRGSRVIAVLKRPLPKLTRWGPSAWTLRVLPVSIRSSGVLCEHMRAIQQ